MHNKLYRNVGDRVSEKNTHLRFISVQIQGAGWQSFLPALEILYTGGCKQWSEVIDDAIIETHKGMSNGCLFILPSFSITLLIWNYVSSKILNGYYCLMWLDHLLEMGVTVFFRIQT